MVKDHTFAVFNFGTLPLGEGVELCVLCLGLNIKLLSNKKIHFFFF